MLRLFSVWSAAAAAAICCVLSGCTPSCTSAPLQAPTTGVQGVAPALPLTAELTQQAHANYLLSKEITYPIVTRGSTHVKQVALTFDDGPHPDRTEELLQVLAQLHVHATFFVVGKMAEKAPYLIQQEILGGHEVANHTFNHIHVTSLDDAQIAHEIYSTNDVIRKFTGQPAVLFRPPGGRLSWGAYRALHACGMVTVLWTDDPRDYTNPGKPDPVNQKLLLKRLMDHIRPGGIILLHDGILDTVAILPEFIRELRARGYEVGTVTQLLLAEQHREWPERLAGNHPLMPASFDPPRGKSQPNWAPVPGSIVPAKAPPRAGAGRSA